MPTVQHHSYDLVVHAGMPKTGSTAIQDALASAGPRIGDDLYPTVGRRGTAHHMLAWALRDPSDARVAEAGLAGTGLSEQFEAELDSERPKRVVISSEALFHLHAASLSWFAAQGARSAVAYLYLREPAAYVESWYRQRIQMSTYAHTMTEHLQELRVQTYAKRLAAYHGAFGPEHIRLRPYDRASLVGGDVVSDFGSWIESDLSGGSSRSANASLDPELVEFKRMMNPGLESRQAPVVGEALVRWSVDRERRSATLLTEAECAVVRSRVGAEFDSVARPHGLTLDDLPISERPYERPAVDEERFRQLTAELIERDPKFESIVPFDVPPRVGGNDDA